MRGKRLGWYKNKIIASPGSIVAGATVNLDAGNASSYPGSGTDWFDLTDNNYDATLVNGVGYDAGNGGTLVFNGSTQYVNNDSTTEAFSFPFTAEIWFNTDLLASAGVFQTLFTFKKGAGTLQHIYIVLVPTASFGSYGTVHFGYNSGLRAQITDAIPNNSWHQLVLVYDGVDISDSSSFKLYLNAVSKSVTTSVAVFTPTGNANEIGRLNSSLFYFDGKIPIFNLYNNKEFTQEEVTQNFDFYKDRFGL